MSMSEAIRFISGRSRQSMTGLQSFHTIANRRRGSQDGAIKSTNTGTRYIPIAIENANIEYLH